MKRRLSLLTIALMSTPVAAGDYLSVGLGAIYSPSPYKGMSTQITPFPSVVYIGKNIRFEGTTASYSFNGVNAPVELLAKVGLDSRIMKPSDSDNADIKKIDKRKPAFIGGIAVRTNMRAAFFEAGVGTDLSGTHGGQYAEAKLGFNINRGPIGITPEIGYHINTARIHNHLYGVSASEASRTNFDEFKMGMQGQYFIGLSSYMYFSKNISLISNLRYVNLRGEIKNSPILKETNTLSGLIGVNYSF